MTNDELIRKLRSAKIKVITSGKHSKRGVKGVFRNLTKIFHQITSKDKKFLHAKIYLFEKGCSFKLIVGSANMMLSGLTSYDELSVLLEGNVGDCVLLEAKNYICRVKKELLD